MDEMIADNVKSAAPSASSLSMLALPFLVLRSGS